MRVFLLLSLIALSLALESEDEYEDASPKLCIGSTPPMIYIDQVMPLPEANQIPIVQIRNSGGQVSLIDLWSVGTTCPLKSLQLCLSTTVSQPNGMEAD